MIQATGAAVSWWRGDRAEQAPSPDREDVGLGGWTARGAQRHGRRRRSTFGRRATATGRAGGAGAWRCFCTLRARTLLLQLAYLACQEVALGLGCCVGRRRDVHEQACGRVANDGPCRRSRFGDTLDFTQSTSTTIFADLTLVGRLRTCYW